MLKIRNWLLVLVCGALISGCASNSTNVSASYISPIIYKKFSCKQIREEAVRVSQQVATLSGVQDKKASNDAVATGVALILFWPAAFMVGGDDHNTAQLAQMKGKYEALRAESEKKRCNIKFQTAKPDPKAKEKKKKDLGTFERTR